MPSTLPLHPDGCIIANIRVKHFLVYFTPKCEHTKLRGAYVAVDAENADTALIYAHNWIRLAQLSPASVTEVSSNGDTYPFAITEPVI
jgi:hypothetical protein